MTTLQALLRDPLRAKLPARSRACVPAGARPAPILAVVGGRGQRFALAIAATLVAALGQAVPALAAEAAPQFSISSVSQPTAFSAGREGSYQILLTNSGGAVAGCTKAQSGREGATKEGLEGGHEDEAEPVRFRPPNAPLSNPITVTVELPPGLSPLPGALAVDQLGATENNPGYDFSKSCAPDGELGKLTCTYEGVVFPDDTLSLHIPVEVSAAPPSSCSAAVHLAPGAVACLAPVVRVSGGGAPAASAQTPTFVFPDEAIANAETPFGLASGGAVTALSSLAAGAHPDITTSAAFNTIADAGRLGVTSENLKDITYDLPAGFAGDLVDTPACPPAQFLNWDCPSSTQVGITTILLRTETSNGIGAYLQPVYNLQPEPGDVAKLGFSIGEQLHYAGDITVRPPGVQGEPYGLRTTFHDATANSIADISDVALTVWGVPANPIHDALRSHPQGGQGGHGGVLRKFGTRSAGLAAPFFTNPTSCTAAALTARFTVTSWQHPEPSEAPAPTPMPFGPVVGCDGLAMTPSLTAEVTSDSAYAPTGFDLDTSIPQTYPDPEALATPTLKKEVITLPEGMTVNPSAGAGLQACTEAQYSEEGPAEKTGVEKEQGHGCPNASKLATVRIKTPSISEEVTGSVYLATPAPRGEAGQNPFNSLLAVYLVARAGHRGVLVRTPGLVQPDELTGRLTTTFDDLPPLPFSLATFSFNQGANAPLVTPPNCGDYTVTAELTPWSNPEGSPLDPEIPPFPITANCPSGGVPPFAPQVTAGTLNNAAGSYSPLDIKLTRNDGEQEITGFSSQMPPGLTANLTGVAECGEAEIAAAKAQTGAGAESSPACPSGSEIGHTIAEAGVGTVLAQAPGKLYLGAPYEGAPFSIVSVTAAKVGPFDLGTVVVHLPLFLNPETAQVTVGSGTSNQIPHIIKGIVIHVRNIRVYVDRQNFILNPTSCDPMGFAATVIGGGADPTNPADNTPATVTDPFQAADCANLAFKPKFSASTESKDSFNNQGASLKVNLAANQGPNASTGQGVESNIAKVKVELPKSLPSRLTTLQKACTAAQFNANPAGCPAASMIGYATVHTPILPVPLTGPAIFVSHGGEAFPNLILVLQGDGVTIHLVGDTFISKAGITSSTFNTVPDQPFSTFELTLPQGKYSALAATTKVCKPTKTKTVRKRLSVRVHGKLRKVTRTVTQSVAAPLLMPTEMVAQNGLVLKQSTKISVTGCKAAKPAKKAKKKAKGKKGGKK